MRWLATAARELWSLFIDDGLLAGLALAWMILLALAPPHLAPGLSKSGWGGILLALGLALILIESVLRAARNARGRPTDVNARTRHPDL